MKVLIIVDVQKDFIDGTLGTNEAVLIVDGIVKRVKTSYNELILFTQDTHGNDYLKTDEGQKLPVVHCIEGTQGWQINELVKEAWQNNKNTIVINEISENTFKKHTFGSIELANFLKSMEDKVTEIEMLGICTDICVISNAIILKNSMPTTKISINSSLCAGTSPKSHAEALNIMKMCHIDIN